MYLQGEPAAASKSISRAEKLNANRVPSSSNSCDVLTLLAYNAWPSCWRNYIRGTKQKASPEAAINLGSHLLPCGRTCWERSALRSGAPSVLRAAGSTHGGFLVVPDCPGAIHSQRWVGSDPLWGLQCLCENRARKWQATTRGSTMKALETDTLGNEGRGRVSVSEAEPGEGEEQCLKWPNACHFCHPVPKSEVKSFKLFKLSPFYTNSNWWGISLPLFQALSFLAPVLPVFSPIPLWWGSTQVSGGWGGLCCLLGPPHHRRAEGPGPCGHVTCHRT